jgi:hypothetical protein
MKKSEGQQIGDKKREKIGKTCCKSRENNTRFHTFTYKKSRKVIYLNEVQYLFTKSLHFRHLTKSSNFLYDLYYSYINQVLSVDRLRSVQLNGNWGRYMYKNAADKDILEPILGIL